MSNSHPRLKEFIERIQRLEEEKKTIADDIKDILTEAKGEGYDTKAIKKVLALLKMDPDEREYFDGIIDTYLNAVK